MPTILPATRQCREQLKQVPITGRENEGNGLYFYRARYYEPLLGRFISQDPLGFAGSGPNFYAYAGNDPIDFRDPFGLTGPGTVVAGVAGPTATAAEVDSVVAPLVEGAATDLGLGAGFGTVVETGSAGGPAGVAVVGAGVVGWGIGRGVGHVPLIGGGTVDDGWQTIFTSLFYSNPDPNPGAGALFNPHPQPLAGRNCKNRPTEEECDEMYETDLETCRKLRSRSCYAQAAERWAACKAGKPIPPFPFRLPN